MRVPVVAAALPIICLCVAASCGSDTSPTGVQPSHKVFDVVTSGETFLPTIQTISAGDSVRWSFAVAADGLGHNVLFKPRVTGAPNDLPTEIRSGTRTLGFTTKGEFNYVCDLHGGMTGTIIVQ
jgi:plastocyanin